MGSNNNNYLIWVCPQKDNGNIFRYCVDKQHENEKMPIIISGVLNVKNGFNPGGKDEYLQTKDYYPIRICVHSADDILKGQPSESLDIFNQKQLRDKNDITIEEEDGSDGPIKKSFKVPIIHLTLSEIFVESLYGTRSLPNPVPRSYMIMDGSIWNYLVPIVPFIYPDYIPRDENTLGQDYVIEKNGTKKSVYKPGDRFKNVVGIICKNFNNHLYELGTSHEYADLNARLATESFLSGAHATGVAPFIFHSESAISRLIEKEYKSFDYSNDRAESSIVNYIEDNDWRILLVDDKSRTALTPSKYGVTKLQIIVRLLKDLFKNAHVDSKQYGENDENVDENNKQAKEANKDQKGTILVEYVETLEDAEKALKSKKYDIILLDYLLEREGEGRQYGYELLENICNYVDAKSIFDTSSQEEIIGVLLGIGVMPKHERFLQYIVRRGDKYGEVDSIVSQVAACKKKIQENVEKISGKITKEEKEQNLKENEKKKDELYEIVKKHFKENEYRIGPHDKLFFMFISAYTTAVYERLLAEGLNRNEKYWYIGEGACPTNTPELFKYRLLHIMDRRLDQTGIKRLSYENILNVVKKIYEVGDEQGDKREHIASIRRNANEAYHEILGFHYDYFLLKKDEDASVLVASFLKGKEHFGAMLEHMLQLVHLTAFGTVRQWPEIWEECQFLMRTIDDNNDDIRSLKNEIVAAIESYVIDLKSE